jgi:uncharacterized protein with ParB-like and HNH nuclease domain
MNVEARSLIIENVFKKGQFEIPDYQREYDWTDDNLDEFIDDLLDNEDDKYFIGHMVCEGDFNSSKFKVIDGQQRITTITIMLSVIRDIFSELELTNLANGIHENYIFSKDKDYNEYVILKNNMPYPVLQSYVQSKIDKKDKEVKPVKSGEKKIIKAYDKFYKLWKILNEDSLKALRDKILNLEIIFVAVDDEVDAFTIFETLNGKGKDLTPLDLIKNQIFKNYHKSSHLDEPNDSWKKIIQNTQDKNMKFLNYFWASRYKKISDRKIYKEFIKESKKNDFNYNDFVKELLINSIIFKKILVPNIEDWKNEGEFKAYFSLNAISIFNVQVANSLLISLVREYDNKQISLKYLIKALNNIEKFHFVNNAVGGGRSSGLDTMYSKISRDLYVAENKHKKHTIIDELENKLKLKLPTIEQFSANFNKRLYFSSVDTKQKKLVQYVLQKLEYEKQNYNILLKDISLEHIYPEKFDTNWTKTNTENIKNIGNIVLLDKSLNSNIGNKDFLKKKRLIEDKSTILTTKKVFEENLEWNEENIKKRNEELINELYRL